MTLPTPSWEQTEDAMHAALVRASGLPDAQVIWSHQNSNAPVNPYLRLSLGGLATRGLDWLEKTLDLTRDAGQEFETAVKGIRESTLEIEGFTDPVVGSAAAKALVERARTALRLPSVRYLLTRVGVSPFDPGRVDWIPDIPNANFRGRAICSIRIYMPAPTVVEYVGYIQRSNIQLTAHGGGVDPEIRTILAPKT